ncbi:hypothetical protein [Rhizobium sp. BK456]|nr:hypothetical protein [Rhizobium sp. BK456]MBB3523047.1 hypothetical protein [Rhizobium sp. BK456]
MQGFLIGPPWPIGGQPFSPHDAADRSPTPMAGAVTTCDHTSSAPAG